MGFGVLGIAIAILSEVPLWKTTSRLAELAPSCGIFLYPTGSLREMNGSFDAVIPRPGKEVRC
jgi:hypothetical protein